MELLSTLILGKKNSFWTFRNFQDFICLLRCLQITSNVKQTETVANQFTSNEHEGLVVQIYLDKEILKDLILKQEYAWSYKLMCRSLCDGWYSTLLPMDKGLV